MFLGNIAEVNRFNGFKPRIIGLTSFFDSNACPLNTKSFEGKPSLLLVLEQKFLAFPTGPYCSTLRFLTSLCPWVWQAKLAASSAIPLLVLEACFGCFEANIQHCWTMSVIKSVGHHVSWSVDLHVCLRASKAVWMP